MRQKFIKQTILLSLSLISIPQLDQLKDIDTKIQDVVETAVNSNVATVTPLSYKDRELREKSTKFSPGEKLFISLNSPASGEELSECWLLNSNKDRVSKINLSRSGNSPYNYRGETNLPNASGIFYIDINIKDSNSHTAIQQSIEIGEVTKESSTTTVSNQVIAQGSSTTEDITPTPIVYKNDYIPPQADTSQADSNPITIIIKNIIKMILDKLFIKD